MPTRVAFDYAIVRVVPHVERGEFFNAGVILFCRTGKFLAARVALDAERLLALAPGANPEAVEQQLALVPRICAGEGPVGRMSQSERFHWLTAPRSTCIQVSPVHSGLCSDPACMLDHLFAAMVGPTAEDQPATGCV